VNVGDLVYLSNPWSVDRPQFGIVIEIYRAEAYAVCKVLWTKEGSAQIKEHLESSLIELK
jgi:hypothetical protein